MPDFINNTVNGRTGNTILSFLKTLVSKRTLKGVTYLLHPCCAPNIISVTPTVSGTYTIVITLSEVIDLLGLGTANLFIGATLAGTMAWTDSNKITFTGITSSSGSKNVSLQLFLPTDYSDNIGVTQISNTFVVTFP